MSRKNKALKKILAFFLTATLYSTSVGCAFENNKNETSKADIITEADLTNKTSNLEQITEENIESEATKETLNLSNYNAQNIYPFSESKDNSEEYQNYFKNFISSYNLEEYQISDESINKLIEIANTKQKCNFVFKYDKEYLFSLIESNSNEYLKSHKEYTSAFYESNDSYQMYSFKFYTSLVLSKFLSNELDLYTNDINEDIHKMQTLKIVFSLEEGNNCLGEYLKDENLIILYINNIELTIKAQLESKENEIIEYQRLLENLMTKTILHELNHMREFICDCRLEKGDKQQSIAYEFTDDDKAKSFTFLIEAAAESELYNVGNYSDNRDIKSLDFMYYNYRKHETSLWLLNLVNDNVDISMYYNAVFDSDLLSLWNFFDVNSKEEITEFYKIVYAIDGLECRNNLLYDYFGQEWPEDLTVNDATEIIGYSYKTAIFRNVLQDLVEYTEKNNDFSLLDNLTILSLVKNMIVANSNYNDTNFVLDITELNNKYIEYLSSKYLVSLKDINFLENGEVYSKLYNLYDIIYDNNHNCSKNEYYQSNIELIHRFQLLKPIIKFENIYVYEYKNFLEKNKEILEKTNTLERTKNKNN